MADLDAWTKAAKSQHNNSVLFALPASSRPWRQGTTAGYSLEAVAEGPLGAAFAAGIIGVSTIISMLRRVLERKKPVGDRAVNDRVAILFYEDRVDVHRRPMLRTAVGDLLESHPLKDVERPEHDKLVIDGTTWTIFGVRSKELNVALRESEIEIRQG